MKLLWPLTGRSEELRSVENTVFSRDEPRGVALAGAAGVGKTRLARETLSRAGKRGLTTFWIVATGSSRGLPLGAFAPLVGAVSGTPAQVIRQAADALTPRTPAGVMIGVDDAHLLDDMSAILMHHLVMRRMATAVVTVRTGEPVPDAVRALWKDGHLERMTVRPLSKTETGTLLETVLGGPVDQLAGGRVWAATRGNTLFLRELVIGEVDAGRLHRVGGVWRWAGAPELSPALTELVEARMGRLPEPLRAVVEFLALGEPLGTPLLGRLTSPEAVEEAETRGLVQVEHDGRRLQARLAHPLYGEVRRAGMRTLRARRLRGEIATALAGTGGRRANDTLRRAVLAVDSDLTADPALLVEGAGHAARFYDLMLAERLGRAAVPAGGGYRAQLLVASALIGLTRFHEADVELAVLRTLATTEDERIRAVLHQVINLAWMTAQPVEAMEILAETEGGVADEAARLRLAGLRAALESTLARPEVAVTLATAVLASPEPPGEAVVLASYGLTIALGVLGRADEIGAVAAQGFAAASRSAEVAYFRIPLAAMQVLGLKAAGYLREAAEVAHECRAENSEAAFSSEVTGVLVGVVELDRGRVAGSLRWLREARAAMAAYGQAGGWMHGCLIGLTRALAISGDVAAARQALADLLAQRHPTLLFMEPEIGLARAWIAAAEGAVSGAVALAHEAAALAAGRDQPAHEVLALHTAVCFGDRTVAGRLAKLADRVDGPRAPAAAAHAAALAADDGHALHEASLLLEQMGDLLSAADAEAQAVLVHTRHGRRGAALASAARSHRLALACEGARTPALAVAARPLPLTPREREIATLADQGLSNRDIAERLVVSVRTIENHLYRINIKLGTTNRSEFGAFLRDS
ncbi:helix-turn-helix transcriptional regulator [Streptosporangium sp. NBC_01469]|uniref:helix-turn-helix transcriptional regulator n=1 Tax=Streptosporangium sp. NBC_01469 TaxID=2903898 RepID=UPI002E2CFA4C|nr:LuxR C-terminal-related transcriptional regulator [Streptosporangium sp. NBC_01469]